MIWLKILHPIYFLLCFYSIGLLITLAQNINNTQLNTNNSINSTSLYQHTITILIPDDSIFHIELVNGTGSNIGKAEGAENRKEPAAPNLDKLDNKAKCTIENISQRLYLKTKLDGIDDVVTILNNGLYIHVLTISNSLYTYKLNVTPFEHDNKEMNESNGSMNSKTPYAHHDDKGINHNNSNNQDNLVLHNNLTNITNDSILRYCYDNIDDSIYGLTNTHLIIISRVNTITPEYTMINHKITIENELYNMNCHNQSIVIANGKHGIIIFNIQDMSNVYRLDHDDLDVNDIGQINITKALINDQDLIVALNSANNKLYWFHIAFVNNPKPGSSQLANKSSIEIRKSQGYCTNDGCDLDVFDINSYNDLYGIITNKDENRSLFKQYVYQNGVSSRRYVHLEHVNDIILDEIPSSLYLSMEYTILNQTKSFMIIKNKKNTRDVPNGFNDSLRQPSSFPKLINFTNHIDNTNNHTSMTEDSTQANQNYPIDNNTQYNNTNSINPDGSSLYRMILLTDPKTNRNFIVYINNKNEIIANEIMPLRIECSIDKEGIYNIEYNVYNLSCKTHQTPSYCKTLFMHNVTVDNDGYIDSIETKEENIIDEDMKINPNQHEQIKKNLPDNDILSHPIMFFLMIILIISILYSFIKSIINKRKKSYSHLPIDNNSSERNEYQQTPIESTTVEMKYLELDPLEDEDMHNDSHTDTNNLDISNIQLDQRNNWN